MRVTESMGPAWERMKNLLFRPFHLGTWFSLGVAFFLQSCIEGGGGLPNIPSGSSKSSGGGGQPPLPDLSHVDGTILAAVAFGAVALLIPLVLLMNWLGTRGQMMAIRSVATGDSDIGTSWSATSHAGGKLFRLHLVLAAIGFALGLPIAGVGLAVLYPRYREHASMDEMLPTILVLAVVAVAAFVPMAVVRAITRNFLAPIMLKDDVGGREAWRRFWAIGRQHVGGIVLFFFLRSIVGMLAYFAGGLASVLTCCLGFLPVLHQTLMAPYHVFERAWGLEVLASMSPDFDLRGAALGAAGPPAAPSPAGPYDPPAAGVYGAPDTKNPYAPPGYGAPPAGGFGGPSDT